MPRNNDRRTVSSPTRAFSTVCGVSWSIKKAIRPMPDSPAFHSHCSGRKLRADSRDEMTEVWQNCIIPLMFSSKAWSRA